MRKFVVFALMNFKQLTCACLVASGAVSQATVLTFWEPSLDRWMYPFNATPGTRSTASTFGAVGSAGFDDRDAQFLFAFNTAAQVAAGLGAENYVVNSVILTLTVASNNTFAYDPTYDSYMTYLAESHSDYLADTDTGRPIELHGVGYRGGFNTNTFMETTAFSPPGPPAENVRRAFAMGTNSLDASNNVANEMESMLFAVGQTSSVAAGDLVPADTEFTFTLDLTDSAQLSYVQQALNTGKLDFIASSLHPAAFGGDPNYPSFYTKENPLHSPANDDFLAARLTLDVTPVPEPGTVGLLLASAIGFGLWLRRSR